MENQHPDETHQQPSSDSAPAKETAIEKTQPQGQTPGDETTKKTLQSGEAKDRQKLFDVLFKTFVESIRKDWSAQKLREHEHGRRLARLAKATYEQRALYPQQWRTQFARQARTLHSLTGYRDVRSLLFEWLRKSHFLPKNADPFVYSEPRIRRHLSRINRRLDLSPPRQSEASPAAGTAKRVFLTIDNPETTDRDDALSFCRNGDHCEIGVHIALIDDLVPADSDLDRWAFDLSATVYMPHITVPMIPSAVEKLASLDQHTDRLALSFYFVQSNGEYKFDRICSEEIRVDFNSTYDEVERWLIELGLIRDESGNSLPLAPPNSYVPNWLERSRDCPAELVEPLQAWLASSRQLEQRRVAAGGRRFDREHVDVRVNSSGEVDLRSAHQDAPSHKMVSEWMIAANVAAADYCQQHGLPCIHRIQMNASPAGNSENSGEGEDFSPAQPSIERGVHHDLGVEGYSQITSPLRRYTDLIMQRQIVSFLRNQRPAYESGELWRRAQACEEAGRRIHRAESKAAFYYKCVYLSQNLRRPLPARMSYGAPPSKTIALILTNLRLRLFLPLSSIQGLSGRQIPPHHSPIPVRAACLEIDPDRLIMYFNVRKDQRNRKEGD